MLCVFTFKGCVFFQVPNQFVYVMCAHIYYCVGNMGSYIFYCPWKMKSLPSTQWDCHTGVELSLDNNSNHFIARLAHVTELLRKAVPGCLYSLPLIFYMGNTGILEGCFSWAPRISSEVGVSLDSARWALAALNHPILTLVSEGLGKHSLFSILHSISHG